MMLFVCSQNKLRPTQFTSNIVQADIVVDSRVRMIRVASEEFLTEKPQALLFSTDLKLL